MSLVSSCAEDSLTFPIRSNAWAAGLLAGALSGLLLGGCTTPVPLPPVPILSQPETGEVNQLIPYKLQVGDTLDIKFPLNPELNEQVTVSPDGTISTAFMTSVPAYGGTVTDLTERLRNGYKADLTNPRLSVILRTFAPNRVYVAGEVNSPGEFITVGPNLTVSQAIARAGGIKFSADRNKVFVLRRGPNDKAQAFAIDYMGIITASKPEADIRLAQFDVIYVPRTGVGDAYQVFNQYIQQFVPLSGSVNVTAGTVFLTK